MGTVLNFGPTGGRERRSPTETVLLFWTRGGLGGALRVGPSLVFLNTTGFGIERFGMRIDEPIDNGVRVVSSESALPMRRGGCVL